MKYQTTDKRINKEFLNQMGFINDDLSLKNKGGLIWWNRNNDREVTIRMKENKKNGNFNMNLLSENPSDQNSVSKISVKNITESIFKSILNSLGF